ncbi:molybdenum ABC transporter ATP-binding protein [Profundibacterium mesophilum]|uniref:ABC molybdate transporter ATPase subunit ModC n=1 Tax=Profundibacterium mesophilum KAUST100406-0324 TaxID=1037889 RepID=A0A921TCK2_9RHOB|nr:molybdenum ABC transporter ATP-binding protein [Profundibacterium mesophilum]KAF0677205.1 ABC molybdate transporter ATPase subunit ModC [Profundibacterium mesophilum KAUST100406-0324]
MSLRVSLRHALPGFTLDARFEAPEGVTALFGPSGAGKSTVVLAIAGLVRPDAGRIEVNGRVLLDTDRGIALAAHRRRVGCVFQEGRLFPHLTVRQNLGYGRWFAGRHAAAQPGRVVEMLGIGDLLGRMPADLSGGEKQRVAIGRALLAAPRLLLMDEPLAALDAQRKAGILPYLERLRDETRIPILYVSHAVSEVARLATTVVALRAGRVLRAGPTAELLADPEAVPVLGPRDAGSVLEGRLVAHHEDGLSEVEISGGKLLLPRIEGAPGARVRVRIGAQDVILACLAPQGLSALNILRGEVSALRSGSGPGVIVQLRIGEDSLLARITKRSAAALDLAPGQTCYAIAKSVAVAPADIGGAAPAPLPE